MTGFEHGRMGGHAQPNDAPPFTTLVHLAWEEGRIEHRICFGRTIYQRTIDRHSRVVGFAPNSVFAFVRWASNDYGTVVSRIDILRAIGRGEPFQTLPFVRPGGDLLLKLHGWQKVERVLQFVDAVEALGIESADAAPAYNPLLEVRRGEWEVRDVQNISDVLVDPEGSLEKRSHWEKTSHSLLVGAILHVLYAEKNKTLAGVAAFLSDPRRTIEATLDAMMATPHLGEAGPHPVVASSAQELLNKSDNERSGVLSTAMSFLDLYRDPVVAAVTSRCDWRIANLIADTKPSTLYLVVPPSDISRTKPLIRLVLNQIGRRLTEDLHAQDRRHRVLLLDEFPALGRLHFFEVPLAFLAGYGIKSFLIAQSLNQIEKAYGQNNAILDNCHVRVSFATNDKRTAKRGCVADADDAFIQALKAGTEPARLVFQNGAGRAVELPVSLNGLTAAMNAAEQ